MSPAEKAAAQAKKDAEKARKEAEKAAAKEEKANKRAEKAELARLRDSQVLEERALKEELKAAGIVGKERSAILSKEYAANKTERTDAKTTLSAAGRQSLDNPVTVPSTYDIKEGAGKEVADRMVAALEFSDKYNLAGYNTPNADTKTGFSLNRVDRELGIKEDNGEYRNSGAGSAFKRAENYYGQIEAGDVLTDVEIAKKGNVKSIKPVKGADGIYRVRYGDSENNITEYYQKQPDGNYKPVLLDSYTYDAPDSGGLGVVGNLVGIAVTIWSAGTLGPIAAGALGGAVGGGLSTGSVDGALKGAVTGAIGGAAAQYGGGIASSISEATDSAVSASTVKAAIGGGVSSGTSSALAGNDFSDVLADAVIGAATAGVTKGVTDAVLTELNNPTPSGQYDEPYIASDDVKNYPTTDTGFNNTIAQTVGGAAGGLTNSTLNGTSVSDGIIAGAMTGAGMGLVKDLGVPEASSAVGTLVNSEVKDYLNTGDSSSGGSSGSSTNTGTGTGTGSGTGTGTVDTNPAPSWSMFGPGSVAFKDLRKSRASVWNR